MKELTGKPEKASGLFAVRCDTIPIEELYYE